MYYILFGFLFAILFLPIRIFFPTKIIHKERLPKKQKAILTSNHYSNFDAIVYDIRFVRRFKFMAKKELFKNVFLRTVVKSAGAYPVDREKVTPAVYKKTMEILNKNDQIFIFPEGSRNKSGSEEMTDVKSGVITFASRGDAPIIPMLIYRPPKPFRKNYIIVGEPMYVQGQNPKKLTKEELEENLVRYEEVVKQLREELDETVNKKSKKKK